MGTLQHMQLINNNNTKFVRIAKKKVKTAVSTHSTYIVSSF